MYIYSTSNFVRLILNTPETLFLRPLYYEKRYHESGGYHSTTNAVFCGKKFHFRYEPSHF